RRAFHGWMESFCRRQFDPKVEGFGEGRTRGVRPSRSPMDLGRIDPARRVSRWRAPTLSARSSDGTPSTFATLRVDRLAIGETELFPSNHERLFSRHPGRG